MSGTQNVATKHQLLILSLRKRDENATLTSSCHGSDIEHVSCTRHRDTNVGKTLESSEEGRHINNKRAMCDMP